MSKKYTHSLIFLHGFTMKGDDMKGFTETLNVILPKNAIFKYILPTAPSREITIYSGEKENAWYDYFTENITSEEEINTTQLEESRAEIHTLLDKEVSFLKDSTKVFIGGYSQGCCQALDAGLTYQNKLGGIIGIKGHIPSHTAESTNYDQNIWACHGTNDDSIGYSLVKNKYDEYKGEDFSIEFITLPGANHDLEDGIDESVLGSLQKWIISRL